MPRISCSLRRLVVTALPSLAAGALLLAAAGCEKKETVLDVNGPGGGGMEINETTDLDGDKGLEINVD